MNGLLSATEWLCGVGSETTHATDAFAGSNPSSWLNFEAFDFDAQVEIVEDESIRAVHSGYADQRYGSSSSISWTLPLTGKSGAAGTAPHWAPLLMAGNFKETVNAAVSVEYSLITGMNMSDVPSVTYAHYMLEQDRVNARKMLFLGCRGNRTFSFEMGQIAKISGTDTGKFVEFPSATIAKPANPSAYAGNKKGLLVVGMTLQLGATSYAVESCSFETNWDVNEDRDGTTAGTTLNHVFLSRSRGNRVGGSMTLKGRSNALSNILPAVLSGATFALTVELTDGVDTFKVDAPSLQFGNYSLNKQGHLAFDVPFFLNGTSAGENEVKLTFT